MIRKNTLSLKEIFPICVISLLFFIIINCFESGKSKKGRIPEFQPDICKWCVDEENKPLFKKIALYNQYTNAFVDSFKFRQLQCTHVATARDTIIFARDFLLNNITVIEIYNEIYNKSKTRISRKKWVEIAAQPFTKWAEFQTGCIMKKMDKFKIEIKENTYVFTYIAWFYNPHSNP